MKKLFVGGLAWGTDEGRLSEAFEKYGPVNEARIITDRETGRSRGFGFVTFDNPDDASNAISEMDGTELDGRRIKVAEAMERNRDGGGPGHGNGRQFR
jgi:RNA recognition motif-containing protein